jgi:hypothetical protein
MDHLRASPHKPASNSDSPERRRVPFRVSKILRRPNTELRRPAYVVLVTAHIAGDHANPWEDIIDEQHALKPPYLENRDGVRFALDVSDVRRTMSAYCLPLLDRHRRLFQYRIIRASANH